MKKSIAIAAFILATAMSQVADSKASINDVLECTQEIIEKSTYATRVCAIATARVGSREIFAPIRRNSNQACITASPGSAFTGAANVKQLACLAGRCRYDGPTLSKNNDGSSRLCITAHTWSHSEPFKGGGHAEYRVCSDTKREPSGQEVMKIMESCAKTVASSN